MNAMVDRLLDRLKACGLEIVPGDKPDELKLCGPAAMKTPTLMAAVKAFKPDLLARFARAVRPQSPLPEPDPEPEGESCDSTK